MGRWQPALCPVRSEDVRGLEVLVKSWACVPGCHGTTVTPCVGAGRPVGPRTRPGPQARFREIQEGATLWPGIGDQVLPFLGCSFLQFHWRLPLQGTSHSCRDGAAWEGKAGGDRKASELSQAGGHQGVALEFLRHSWTAPDVAFPDPAGPCLLGINTEEALCTGRGGPWEEEGSPEFGSACVLSARRSSCSSPGQLQASVSSPRKWVWASRFHAGLPVLESARTEQAVPGPAGRQRPPLTHLCDSGSASVKWAG